MNGERAPKKNYEVSIDDEIDIIKGFNQEQRELIDVNRVNIVKVSDLVSGGRIKIQFRKTNRLTIPNYEKDPFELV